MYKVSGINCKCILVDIQAFQQIQSKQGTTLTWEECLNSSKTDNKERVKKVGSIYRIGDNVNNCSVR